MKAWPSAARLVQRRVSISASVKKATESVLVTVSTSVEDLAGPVAVDEVLEVAAQDGSLEQVVVRSGDQRVAPDHHGWLVRKAAIRHLGRERDAQDFELASGDTVRALRPNIPALGQLAARGIIVTARDEGAHDFVSRFFAPRVGVDEDPVTGSAHCCLAPFWAGRGVPARRRRPAA